MVANHSSKKQIRDLIEREAKRGNLLSYTEAKKMTALALRPKLMILSPSKSLPYTETVNDQDNYIQDQIQAALNEDRDVLVYGKTCTGKTQIVKEFLESSLPNLNGSTVAFYASARPNRVELLLQEYHGNRALAQLRESELSTHNLPFDPEAIVSSISSLVERFNIDYLIIDEQRESISHLNHRGLPPKISVVHAGSDLDWHLWPEMTDRRAGVGLLDGATHSRSKAPLMVHCSREHNTSDFKVVLHR